jgi:hypothetical protein
VGIPQIDLQVGAAPAAALLLLALLLVALVVQRGLEVPVMLWWGLALGGAPHGCAVENV